MRWVGYEKKYCAKLTERNGLPYEFTNLPLNKRKWAKVRTRKDRIETQAIITLVALVALTMFTMRNLLKPMTKSTSDFKPQTQTQVETPPDYSSLLLSVPIAAACGLVFVFVTKSVKHRRAIEELREIAKQQERFISQYSLHTPLPSPLPSPAKETAKDP